MSGRVKTIQPHPTCGPGSPGHGRVLSPLESYPKSSGCRVPGKGGVDQQAGGKVFVTISFEFLQTSQAPLELLFLGAVKLQRSILAP